MHSQYVNINKNTYRFKAVPLLLISKIKDKIIGEKIKLRKTFNTRNGCSFKDELILI